MTELLSQDWLDLQRDATAQLPVRTGCSAVIGYEITGGPDGTVHFHSVMEDGRLVANQLGPADEPDFVMHMPRAEFVAVVRGELDPNVGFMQGKIKVTGNIGRMMSVLPVTCSLEWRDAAAAVAEQTTF